MTKFSEYLQRQMDERGWKQADLVRAAGTTSKNVSVWMTKGVIPSADGLAKIAHAFGVPESEVRRAAGEAPRNGYFKLSPERQMDADTLDREQARILDDLIRKFAQDNREKVGNDADSSASNEQAAGSAANEDDKVAHLWSREKAQEPHRRRRPGHDPEWDALYGDRAATYGEEGIAPDEIPDDTP